MTHFFARFIALRSEHSSCTFAHFSPNLVICLSRILTSDVLGIGLLGMHGLQSLPLTSLSLRSCTCLTDAGMEALRGLPLMSLSLYSCRLVTNAGLDDIFKDVPLIELGVDWTIYKTT